jgi:hypothetical protein
MRDAGVECEWVEWEWRWGGGSHGSARHPQNLREKEKTWAQSNPSATEHGERKMKDVRC